jgi:ureidoglycolate hydrolase
VFARQGRLSGSAWQRARAITAPRLFVARSLLVVMDTAAARAQACRQGDERMTELTTVQIPVEPFTAEAFAPFGIILGEPGRAAEFTGNCSHSWLMPFEAEGGTQILYSRYYHQPIRFSLLERHYNVTQGFVPLSGAPLIMVVAPPTPRSGPGAIPAPEMLRAFYMSGAAGLLMHKGTWHTLDRYPVRPPHVDCVFLTARSTQVELMREKSEGIPPVLTEVVDYVTQAGVMFEVVGAEGFTST